MSLIRLIDMSPQKCVEGQYILGEGQYILGEGQYILGEGRERHTFYVCLSSDLWEGTDIYTYTFA